MTKRVKNREIRTITYKMTSTISSLCGIRTKQDLVMLLLEVITQLNTTDLVLVDKFEDHSFSLTLVDMNRIFFKIGTKKIISFVIPFTVTKNPAGSLILYDNKANLVIDSMVTSILKRIMISSFFNSREPDYIPIEESFLEVQESLELDNIELSSSILSVVRNLMLFEPGYMRYDFDEENNNGKYHPLFHIDVNYTNPATFKLGLKKESDVNQIIKVINKKEETFFLSTSK